MNYYNPLTPTINLEQFKRIAPNLSEDFINQLVKQAKEKGISDVDINRGLELIKQLK